MPPPPSLPEDLRLALSEEAARGAAFVSPDVLSAHQARVNDFITRGIGPSTTGHWLTPVALKLALATLVIGGVMGAGLITMKRPPQDDVVSRAPVRHRDAGPPASVTAPPNRAAADTIVDTVALDRDAGVAARPSSATRAEGPRDAGHNGARPNEAVKSNPPRTGKTTTKKPTRKGSAAATPSGGVGAQLRVFERAEAARAEGRFQAAERAYRSYLQTYPQGVLVHEARLGLARLLRGQGGVEEARGLLNAIVSGDAPASLRTKAQALLDAMRSP